MSAEHGSRSHGNVSHHVQVSLDPAINHDKFRVFSGFGQQLGPIVHFGAAGVIDGLAAFYPKAVVRLMSLAEARPIEPAALQEAQKLQQAISVAQEYIGNFGIIGIKEAIFRVTGFGISEGGRLPLKGKVPDGEWEEWHRRVLSPVQAFEAQL